MFDMAKIEIGKKAYILRFPLDSMLKAEKALGKPIAAVFTPKKDENGVPKLPEFGLTELVPLFDIGMSAEYPDMSKDRKEELLSNFLQEGTSLVQQVGILYALLGKAMGFFRTEIDLQKKMNKTLEEVRKTKSVSEPGQN